MGALIKTLQANRGSGGVYPSVYFWLEPISKPLLSVYSDTRGHLMIVKKNVFIPIFFFHFEKRPSIRLFLFFSFFFLKVFLLTLLSVCSDTRMRLMSLLNLSSSCRSTTVVGVMPSTPNFLRTWKKRRKNSHFK